MPDADAEQLMVEKNPMRRLGRHEELANLASYLISPYAGFINGEVVTIDGGEWLSGAGVGKKLLNLRVEATNGGKLTLWSAFFRRLFDPVDFWMSCGLVALIMRNETERGRRLGDKASGTVVVCSR